MANNPHLEEKLAEFQKAPTERNYCFMMGYIRALADSLVISFDDKLEIQRLLTLARYVEGQKEKSDESK